MRRIAMFLGLFLVLGGAGCSSISVNHDWDRDAPFETYRTFKFKPKRPDSQGGRVSGLVQKRIESYTVQYLVAAGLREKEDPDLLVGRLAGLRIQADAPQRRALALRAAEDEPPVPGPARRRPRLLRTRRPPY